MTSPQEPQGQDRADTGPHPVTELAAQISETAGRMCLLLHAIGDASHAGISWPRDLTADERAGLISRLRDVVAVSGLCAETMAADPLLEARSRECLGEADHLLLGAFTKILEAQGAGMSQDDGPSRGQRHPAAEDFPRAPVEDSPGPSAGSTVRHPPAQSPGATSTPRTIQPRRSRGHL